MKYLILLALMAPSLSYSTTVQSYLHNRRALKQYNAKAYYPAYRSLLEGLESDPLNSALHLNMGRAFEENEEFEKAQQAYQSALALLPEGSRLRFEALFNLGSALGKDKKIDAALSAYQAALEIEPESIEVKHNIELLMQQQQGGGGGGEGDPKEDQKDGKGDQEKENPEPKDGDKPENKPKPKPQPKPFDSKELTPQDVKKILDEIKNQEQGIRAKEFDKAGKEAPRGKDW